MGILILSIVFHAAATIFIKLGAVSIEKFTILSVMTNPFYLSSLFLYFLQAITWQVALKNIRLNNAYVYTSLYYPFILLASFFIFNEGITVGNVFGTLAIMSGLALHKRPKASA